MKLNRLLLVFAIASAVFFLLLIFFRVPFPLYPLMSWQDALDLLTPLILIPIYWALFRATDSSSSSPLEVYAFMILAAAFVLGHGMHLSANSVNNLAEGLARDGGLDIIDSDIYRLTYFFDEYLSHYVWHIGVLGLAGLLMWRAQRQTIAARVDWWAVSGGGLVYGFTLFAIVLEGQTTPAGFPFMGLAAALAVAAGRNRLSKSPLFAFFFISLSVAVVLFSCWGLYWQGFPEFTAVGLF